MRFCESVFSFGELPSEAIRALTVTLAVSGLVLAVGGACRAWKANQSRRRRRRIARSRVDWDVLGGGLAADEQDRMLSTLESKLLREIAGETDATRAVEALLRRYIPDPGEAFAAFLRYDDGDYALCASRGLSDEASRSLRMDDALARRLACESLIAMTPEELEQAPIRAGLADDDRRKARQLFLIAVGDGPHRAGALLSTVLYPAWGSLNQQANLARRLMGRVAGDLRRSLILARQEDQLQSTSEMLALRGILDGKAGAAPGSFEAFLSGLRRSLAADAVTLFARDSSGDFVERAASRSDLVVAAGNRDEWRASEWQLVDNAVRRKTSDSGQCEGDAAGLVRSALVLPLTAPEGLVGWLCASRSTAAPFSASQRALAAWAATFVMEHFGRLREQAEIVRQARQDGLTQLANRRAFDEQLNLELRFASRNNAPCSLLLLDLDRFKSINDTHGHLAGDEVLRVAARVLRDQVAQTRSSDRAFLARYGGEEMAVLLPATSAQGAFRIGETIRAAIAAQTVRFGSTVIRVTISGGIAASRQGTTAQELIAEADAMLYQAKEKGRNRILVAEDPNLETAGPLSSHDTCERHPAPRARVGKPAPHEPAVPMP